jgi:hypothetical protein
MLSAPARAKWTPSQSRALVSAQFSRLKARNPQVKRMRPPTVHNREPSRVGVDADSPTGAAGLYERLGFVIGDSTGVAYRKMLLE